MRYVDTRIDDRDMNPITLTETLCESGIRFDEATLEIDVGIVVMMGVRGSVCVYGITLQGLRQLYPFVLGEYFEQCIPGHTRRRLQHDAIQVEGLDRPPGNLMQSVTLLQRRQRGSRVLAGAVMP